MTVRFDPSHIDGTRVTVAASLMLLFRAGTARGTAAVAMLA